MFIPCTINLGYRDFFGQINLRVSGFWIKRTFRRSLVRVSLHSVRVYTLHDKPEVSQLRQFMNDRTSRIPTDSYGHMVGVRFANLFRRISRARSDHPIQPSWLEHSFLHRRPAKALNPGRIAKSKRNTSRFLWVHVRFPTLFDGIQERDRNYNSLEQSFLHRPPAKVLKISKNRKSTAKNYKVNLISP